MGDHHESLAPGHRLPDTIEIHHANGQRQRLHELTHRANHTALIVGGLNTGVDPLTDLAAAIRMRGPAHLIEQVFTLSSGFPTPLLHCPSAARSLGATGMTLFLIRPDGHIGLRADRHHMEQLEAFCSKITKQSA